MKITITRALAELKLYDARIKKKTNELVLIECKSGRVKTTMLKGIDPEVFEANAKEGYQSIIQLIENRRKMKARIMASNSQTKVKIGDSEYTVVEAIEKKASIEYLMALLVTMKQQHALATSRAAQINANIEQQVMDMMKNNLSGTEKKMSESDYEAIGKPIREANQATVLDPIKLAEKIVQLETDIDNFKTEVDFILSESNSRTEIDM